MELKLIKELTDNNVDAVVNSNKASFILFYEQNIPSLKSIQQVFYNFDEQLKGKVDIMFCDIEKNLHVNEYFKMNILPAVLFIKNGKVYGNLAGPASAKKYEDILKEALSKLISEQQK